MNKMTRCTNPHWFSERRRCDSSDHINRALTILSMVYLLMYIGVVATINGKRGGVTGHFWSHYLLYKHDLRQRKFVSSTLQFVLCFLVTQCVIKHRIYASILWQAIIMTGRRVGGNLTAVASALLFGVA